MAKPKQKRQPNAPDPATVYERAKPESEAGMGRLDNNDDATPTKTDDRPDKTVSHRQGPRQINAEDPPEK